MKSVEKLAKELLTTCRKFVARRPLKKKERLQLSFLDDDSSTAEAFLGASLGTLRRELIALAEKQRKPTHPFQRRLERMSSPLASFFEHLHVGSVTLSIQGNNKVRCHPKLWLPLPEWYSHYDVALWYTERENEWHWLKPSDLGVDGLDNHWETGHEEQNGEYVPTEDVQRIVDAAEPAIEFGGFAVGNSST